MNASVELPEKVAPVPKTKRIVPQLSYKRQGTPISIKHRWGGDRVQQLWHEYAEWDFDSTVAAKGFVKENPGFKWRIMCCRVCTRWHVNEV